MKSRNITFMPAIEEIIAECRVCHLAMAGQSGEPYVLPFNFGYREGVFYFHSAPQGWKLEVLKENPRVCIALSTGYDLRWQHEDVACSYSMKYKSVLARGEVEFIEEYDEKVEGMNIIMKQYVEKDFSYNRPAIENVMVYKVKVKKFECRVYGY
ncbi:MAG: pyridoxamine 5'-phosphate oxidase family protein [Bacteroidales bacterium]|nr:pyridoxamine 5'-phosphate oxidase family protein [Bacteroidales bacterium]